MTVGERDHERKIILNFLIISCQSAFIGIIWRSFLKRLDVVASSFHLKVTYHNMKGRSILVTTNIDEAKLIKLIVQKDLLASAITSKA